jgi:hypothetical protein
VPTSDASPPASSPQYPLEEEFWETDSARLRRWIPWLHLFRAFRIAMDYRKLTLALAAVLLLAAGDWAFARLPFSQTTFRPQWPWQPGFLRSAPEAPHPLADAAIERSSEFVDSSRERLLVVQPLYRFIDAGWVLIGNSRSWQETAMAWTRLLWFLLVGGLFGGAIIRLAALDFTGRHGSLRGALTYCGKRLLSFVGGPLLPGIAVFLLWTGGAIAGLVAAIPAIGPWITGALWFLPLIFGLMMAVVVLGVAAGWPLMYATIGTEGSDAFDGLSRSYSYLFARPWYLLWMTVLSCVYGLILLVFLQNVIDLGVQCTLWSVKSGAGADRLHALVPAEFPALAESELTASHTTTFWINALRTFEPAFLYSFFWTCVTIVYLLLRRSVDGTPLDAVDEDLALVTDLPLVGVPAVERREAAAATAAPTGTNPAQAPAETPVETKAGPPE